ncbi:Uncharacterised protein [Corynebacterium imitans]|uniref:Uncharacterized protein n=2 Tax=Corynebacterium imitans TaxID=156978 RepID=A0A240A4E8_9CORY|nr:Uncharacterised protein [Corynebacterium imitans]
MIQRSMRYWKVLKQVTCSFQEWPSLHRKSDGAAIAGPNNRFKFLANGYVVPCHFVRSEEFSDRLLVTLNGAVDRSESKDPREIFQRRTWIDSLNANVLMISDATLHPDNDLQIGWAQGNGTDALLCAMAECVEYFRNLLGLRQDQVIFYGSSAGGFQAVALHAWFPGSRFLVNNAQFDWTLYYPSYVRDIAEHSYGGLDVENIRTAFPEKCNVLSRYLALQLPISGCYMLNVASAADMKKQLPVLSRFMANRATEQPHVGMDISVKYYIDRKAGHLPLPKDQTLKELSVQLSLANPGRGNCE